MPLFCLAWSSVCLPKIPSAALGLDFGSGTFESVVRQSYQRRKSGLHHYRECSENCVRENISRERLVHKQFFCEMKKRRTESASYFTEGTESALIQDLYDGTSLSELMAPIA